MTIHADSTVSVAELNAGELLTATLSPRRHGWLQTLRGEVTVNGQTLQAGDGAAVTEETEVTLAAQAPSEVLWFDLD
jgi:quercetin 2,3-dioxygenase